MRLNLGIINASITYFLVVAIADDNNLFIGV